METMFPDKIEVFVGEARKEMSSERDARQQLEERILQLEAKHVTRTWRFPMQRSLTNH